MAPTLLALLLLVAVGAAAAQPSTRTPITHLVIIIEENHSFDNIYGVYPYGVPPINNSVTRSLMRPVGLNLTVTVPYVPWLPFLGGMRPYYADSYSTGDPIEGWTSYHGDLWFNTSQGFVFYSSGVSMAYYSYQQVPLLWDYAEEYVLADNFYAPILGLTEPNRVADLIGSPPPFLSDNAFGVIPFNRTIMAQLSAAGVSWAYYVYSLANGSTPYPLTAFTGTHAYETHFQDLSAFYSALRHGTLPSVSWVMFMGGSNDAYDLHPPDNMTAGQVMLSKVVDALMDSAYWNSSAVFITMDEGGGFYDQVAPPRVTAYGLGQRIPLLIVSPYAREAWIINQTLSGYTILGFIDYNWRLPPLTQYVAQSDVQGLLSGFNFNREPRAPLVITPQNWSYPLPLQYPVDHGQVATLAGPSAQKSGPPVVFAYLAAATVALIPLLTFSTKARRLSGVTLVGSLIVASAGYYYTRLQSPPTYSFLGVYYLGAGIIIVLASGLLALRRRPRYRGPTDKSSKA